MDTRRSAENIATLSTPAAEIPKKTLPTFKRQTRTKGNPGLWMVSLRNTKTQMANIDWQTMRKGTDWNTKIDNIILLNMIMRKEEAM